MVECLWQQGSVGSRGRMPPDGSEGSIRNRVLHVVNGEHYAGAERVQDLLGGALPWFGYEVGFACVKPGQFSVARKNRGVPLVECRMGRRFDFRPVGGLVRLIRERGYELLHAHTPRSLMLASAASVFARVPLVYHIHSPAMADTTSRLRNRTNALLERMSLAFASHLIAVSNSLRQRYLGLGFSPDRITVVSNGVCCGTRLPPRERSADEPVVFGMAALFRPRKGLEVLLKSMADLLAGGHRLRLRAIGQFETREYEQQVKSLAVDLGVDQAIDWTGFSSSIEHELAQIDCFVLPSLFGEGLPMVILEAMASGRPVIATNVEGVPEAIRHGETGLLARPNDPASLAQTMKRVLDGSVDLQALVQGAALDQRERFSVCSMARRTAEVYDRVLEVVRKASSRDWGGTPCAVSAASSSDAFDAEGLSLPTVAFTPTPEQRV